MERDSALLLACLLAVPLEIFEISKESKPLSFVVASRLC
jgi:hypothetical protein